MRNIFGFNEIDQSLELVINVALQVSVFFARILIDKLAIYMWRERQAYTRRHAIPYVGV